MASRGQIERLIDRFDPIVKEAFLAAFDEVASNVDMARLVAALERGNIGEAIAALHLTPEAFATLDAAISDAYKAGGHTTIASLPPIENGAGKLVIRFDARNPAAENWLREHSSELITAIIDDQREAIRNALEAGMKAGQNPRRVALDIVGRYNSETRKREGGILGLTAQQEEFARSAATELRSADPKLLRNYLDRKARDKRFDAAIEKAIETGKPIPEAQAARIEQRYRDRLLKVRGDMIGRTEAGAAVHTAQDEAMRQAVASGALSEDQIDWIWRTSIDGRERRTHHIMNGQVAKYGQPFISPSGARIRFPHDPQAPAAETIGCRCWREPKVNFLKGIR